MCMCMSVCEPKRACWFYLWVVVALVFLCDSPSVCCVFVLLCRVLSLSKEKVIYPGSCGADYVFIYVCLLLCMCRSFSLKVSLVHIRLFSSWLHFTRVPQLKRLRFSGGGGVVRCLSPVAYMRASTLLCVPTYNGWKPLGHSLGVKQILGRSSFSFLQQ